MDLKVEFQKDVKRRIVNNELIMLYGNDAAHCLPPLPVHPRPVTSIVPAWSCGNPALRQLGNLQRRGPRKSLPGSKQTLTAVMPPSLLQRPRTAGYTSLIMDVFNKRAEEEVLKERPYSSLAELESMPYRRLAPPEDLEKLITPAISLARSGTVMDDDDDEDFPDYLNAASASSLQRKPKPRNPKSPRRKKKGSRKNQSASADVKRREEVLRVLQGDWDSLPKEAPTAVRIYIAANATDMVEERRVIQKRAFPVLQEYCREQGLDCHLVDLKWGAPSYVDWDLNFSRLHLQEINNCRRHSIGPCFIALLGDKYGAATAPVVIAKDEFETLRTVAEEARFGKAYLLEEWYEKDENSTPLVYVLQMEPTGKSYKGKKVKAAAAGDPEATCEMQQETLLILQESVNIAVSQGKLKSDSKHKYFSSVLESEVDAGILEMEVPTDTSMCYMRQLTDLPTHVINKVTTQYSDVILNAKKPHLNEISRQKLADLKTNVSGRLGGANIRKYQTTMKEYILGETENGNKSYLDRFSDDLVKDMKEMIERGRETWQPCTSVQHYKLYKEVLQHAKMCQQRAGMLVGRKEEIETIETYIQSENGDSEPMVIHGKLGVGKTAIMAKVAKLCPDWLGPSSVLIMRFLGISPASVNLKVLLHDLCLQICVTYNLDTPPEVDLESADKLARIFQKLLDQVSKFHGEKQPLMLMIAGLDKLAPVHRAHTLFWLPVKCPPFIHIIVSVSSTKYNILNKLRRRIKREENFVEIEDISEKTVEEIFVRTLQKRNRQLTSDQRDLLLNKCRAHPNPMYTNLTAVDALSWGSYTTLPENILPAIVEDLIWKKLVSLENKYVPQLVAAMLSCLAVSPYGLTETELRDALSCNDAMLKELLTEMTHIPDDNVFMPSFLLSQLLNELRLFLNEREIEGKNVIVFHHPLLREICRRKYHAESQTAATERVESRDKSFRDLAEIFLQETGVKKVFIWPGDQRVESMNRYVTAQPLDKGNMRKLKLLPFLISQSGNFTDVKDNLKKNCLCNFKWLYTSLQALHIDSILADFNFVIQRDNCISLVRDMFKLNRLPLKQNPQSLATYIVGSLPRLGETHRHAMDLLKQAQAWLDSTSDPVLIPKFPCLPSAHDMCKGEMWGVGEVISLDYTGQLAVMKAKDGTAQIWDIKSEEFVFSLGVRFDKISPNVFCSDECVLTINGMDLKIWEIESGIDLKEYDLSKLLGESAASILVLAHSEDMHHIALHSADDDFNQMVCILNTETGEDFKITDFDIKDEFYKQSAHFTKGNRNLVFVSAKSITNDEDNSIDMVRLNVFDRMEKTYSHQLECGDKHFHSLLMRDEITVIVCWKDGSFDLYDIVQGTHVVDMEPPGSNLSLQMCTLTDGNDLTFLVTKTNDAMFNGSSTMFSAMWNWCVEEQDLKQIMYMETETEDEICTKFIMPPKYNVLILACEKKGTIHVWNTVKGECIRSIQAHTQNLTSLLPTSNLFVILSGSAEEGVVKMWNLHRILPKAVSLKLAELPTSSILINKSGEGVRRPKVRKISRVRIGSAMSTTTNRSVRFADELSDDETTSVMSESSRRDLVAVAMEEADYEITPEDPTVDYDLKDYQTEMKAMFGVSKAAFTKDNLYVITGAYDTLPGLWSLVDGNLVCRMDPHSSEDVGAPWIALGSSDRFVVGLCSTKDTFIKYPHVYLFRIWQADSGDAVQMGSEISATACTLTADAERAVVSNVTNYDEESKENWVVTFSMVNVSDQQVLREVVYRNQTVPTTIDLTEDDKYAVTNNITRPGAPSSAMRMFPIPAPDNKSSMQQAPNTYVYLQGKKYKEYRAAFNVVLKNGLSAAIGLNGDVQLWDIQTCEYESNLYHDASVKDTGNASLHNHGGYGMTCAVVSQDGHYLLAGAEDNSASLWDLEEEILLHIYKGHSHQVTCVCISSDNQLLLTGAEDCMLHIYHFGVPDKPVCCLYLHVVPSSIHITDNKETIAAIGKRKNEPNRFMLFKTHNI